MVTVPLPAPAADSRLQTEVLSLRDHFAALWEETPEELPPLGRRVGWIPHWRNARAARRLIDSLSAEVKDLPDGAPERAAWQETVRERLLRFGEERLGWPAGYRRLVFGEALFAASLDFVREARAVDPGISVESVWQALRNVWIGNSLQMILGLPVRLSPGLFAYSMLYPLTDNLLDDPGVSHAAKQAFNQRLGWRLMGRPASATSATEAAIFRMIGRIEEEFPRQAFDEVHESLLAIHGAQALSLRQQTDPGLTEADILAISCHKGGSSVLADLYLVSGTPRPEQRRFAFGHGVFLQLLDDLRDAEADSSVGHQTLFTRGAERGPLDDLAARLLRFIDRVLDGQKPSTAPLPADHKDLIRRNCRSLVVAAVVEQPRMFTRGFRRELCSRWPFAFRSMRRLRHRAERRFRGAGEVLQRRAGAQSLLDWALSQQPSP